MYRESKMIGQTISHYRIIEKLGEGGMGVVYKAQDLKLDRFVALKFLPPHLTSSEEEKQRFIHEAKATSTLEHNNICNIHEIDETEDGQLFISMAYYEGETLKMKIEPGQLLSIDEILNIAIQIANGLARAHESNITHRDLKPANIMITDRGEVKIVDFGLAKLAGQTKLTKEGTTLGTVAYMSPEQTRGEKVDHHSDIWSLGVLLYEMITGQLPFKGNYDQAIMYSIANENPEPLTGVRTNVPVELERIVNKSLAKSPDERYQHVDEMLTDLKKLKKELETPDKIQPPRVMEEESKKKWLKRLLIPIGLLIVVVLGFLLLRPILFEEVLVSEPKPIAVISFENQTGDETYDYLAKAIPNLLITNLEQSKYLRVTTWERMHDLLKQLGKEDVEIIDKDLGYELCRMDGVDAIVLGSFTKVGNIFATDIKVLDVNNKRILKSTNSKGKGEDSILETQIDELSKEISRGVGLSDRKIKTTQQRIADVTTTSMDAYNYFLRGREDYEKFYFDDAQKFLEKAVELDSAFATAYLSLARAYDVVWDYKARNVAYEKAKTFAGKATDKERLYIEAAYASVIERNPDKRFHILKQMADKYPKEKRVHYLLASYYKNKNLHNEAIQEFNKALELDPNYGEAINLLAYLYVDMGNFEQAFEYYKRYASVSPGDANPFDSMGDLYFQLGKLDEAMAKYKEALEVKPDFFSSYLKVGYLFALKEDYSETVKWINQCIATAQSPGLKAEGLWWKGFYHQWLCRPDLALDEFNEVTDFAEAVKNELLISTVDWLNGCIYYERGELEFSQRHFKNWFDFRIEYYPKDVPYYTAAYNFFLGLIDLKEGQIDSAMSRLVKIKSILPEVEPPAFEPSNINLITYYYEILYAEKLLVEDSLEQVIVVCEKAKSLEIPSTSVYYMVVYNVLLPGDVLARAYKKNGELNKAIAEYERLTNFDPNIRGRLLIHPRYHFRLASLYEEKGWFEKATKEYEKFLEIWKDADKDLPELIEAKKRLTTLKETPIK
jgi:serine/threonine protein kinase/Tfp pilus assembly protein PilF